MIRTIRIIVFILWVIMSPVVFLAIAISGIEIFDPIELSKDIVTAQAEPAILRMAAIFVVIYPFYLLFYFLKKQYKKDVGDV
mgnify:CR=1 FL=1